MAETTTEIVDVVTVKSDGAGYTVPRAEINTVLDEIRVAADECGDEQTFTVRFHRMPRAELDALPEFDGW